MVATIKQVRMEHGLSLDEARDHVMKCHYYEMIDKASTLEEIKDILKVLVFKNRI